MATWFRTHSTLLLLGASVTIPPIVYVQYADVSWYPLNPYDHLIQNSLAYGFLVLFSFVNYRVFVPRWYLAKRYSRYALITITCLLSIVWLSHRIEQWVFFKTPNEHTISGWAKQILWAENMFEHPPNDRYRLDLKASSHSPEQSPVGVSPHPINEEPFRNQPGHLHRRGPGPWSKMTIIFLVGGISTLLSISIQFANWLRQVERDRLEAELRQLKAQIYPHFLFNTLNSIYALAIRKDDRTADTIVKLSEFMRYMIRDAHCDKVLLTTEITYVSNYIDLQKTRVRDVVFVNLQVEGDLSRWQIAPLLLFSYIENAFKYGVNPKVKSVISIRLILEDSVLRLIVSNQKVAAPTLDESTGVGLHNTRERLALLYPGAHTLVIDDTPTQFTVDLTLRLIS